MKKLILGLLLSSGILMASNLQKDDLLQFATAGKSMGSSLEMSKTDMKKADGGWSFYTSYYNSLYSLLNYYSRYRSYSYARSNRIRYGSYSSRSRYSYSYSSGSRYNRSYSRYSYTPRDNYTNRLHIWHH